LALAAIGGYTHVFFNIWIRQATEDENRRVNSAIVANVLDALSGEPVEHVALVTGLKHYLGQFERYAESPAATPFREDQGRLAFSNFYYDQEDVLFEASARDDFKWSVDRAHTVIGWGPTNSMNMGATLSTLRPTRASRPCWSSRWPGPSRSGTISSPSTASSPTPSRPSPPGGTPTPTSAARSRPSPT
jgi:hypothetical protein